MVKQANKDGWLSKLEKPSKMDILTVAQLAKVWIATVSCTINRDMATTRVDAELGINTNPYRRGIWVKAGTAWRATCFMVSAANSTSAIARDRKIS